MAHPEGVKHGWWQHWGKWWHPDGHEKPNEHEKPGGHQWWPHPHGYPQRPEHDDPTPTPTAPVYPGESTAAPVVPSGEPTPTCWTKCFEKAGITSEDQLCGNTAVNACIAKDCCKEEDKAYWTWYSDFCPAPSSGAGPISSSVIWSAPSYPSADPSSVAAPVYPSADPSSVAAPESSIPAYPSWLAPSGTYLSSQTVQPYPSWSSQTVQPYPSSSWGPSPTIINYSSQTVQPYPSWSASSNTFFPSNTINPYPSW